VAVALTTLTAEMEPAWRRRTNLCSLCWAVRVDDAIANGKARRIAAVTGFSAAAWLLLRHATRSQALVARQLRLRWRQRSMGQCVWTGVALCLASRPRASLSAFGNGRTFAVVVHLLARLHVPLLGTDPCPRAVETPNTLPAQVLSV
jgi:hypothetical protein